MKTTLVYKMVRNCGDGIYKSYCGDHKWTVVYQLKAKATAPIGGLFCFTSLEDCLRYIHEEFSGYIPRACSILECKTRCKIKPLQVMGCPSEEAIEAFWKREVGKYDTLYTPFRTCRVKSLVPTRVINIQQAFEAQAL